MAKRAPRSEHLRSTTLTVRLTAGERTMVEQRAAAANLTPSGYLAALVRDGRVVVEQRETISAADLAQLKRIGNNINQLAHAANTGLPPAAHDVVASMRRLMTWLLTNEITRRRLEAFQAEAQAQGDVDHGAEAGQARIEFQRRVSLSPSR